jgi:plasmid stabilization system protein ParE
VSYKVRFSPAAECDLAEAYAWYEDHATGLGAEFLRQVSIQEARLSRNPLVHAIAYAHIRRALLGRFPYSLHFEMMGETVLVLACIHQHRAPTRWPATN